MPTIGIYKVAKNDKAQIECAKAKKVHSDQFWDTVVFFVVASILALGVLFFLYAMPWLVFIVLTVIVIDRLQRDQQ